MNLLLLLFVVGTSLCTGVAFGDEMPSKKGAPKKADHSGHSHDQGKKHKKCSECEKNEKDCKCEDTHKQSDKHENDDNHAH